MDADGWQLRNAEQTHRANPATFWIPEREIRTTRKRGDGVERVFDIATIDGCGQARCGGERMWGVVLERVGGLYLGVLDGEPVSIEPGTGSLFRGCRVWFGPEHIIDTSDVPRDYLRAAFPREFAT